MTATNENELVRDSASGGSHCQARRIRGDIVQNSKITTEELRELAGFWAEQADALSVYIKPPAAMQLSHREEPIYVKDKVMQTLGTLRASSPVAKVDIQRVVDTVSAMNGNNGRAKIIFACAREGIWREFDVPGDFGFSLDVGAAFTLAPLIADLQSRRRYCIALADRNRARLLLLEAREISEHSQVLDEEKEKIRSTGARKSVHLERKKEEGARRHFAFLADHLLHFHEHGDFDCLIVGCREEMWPEIEAELHPDLKQVLVGRFACDPGYATREEIEQKAQTIVDSKDRLDEERLVERTVGAAAANGLGAVGLKAVISALERGEVRTILWTNTARPAHRQRAALCPNCGHLEATGTKKCGLCKGSMRQFTDAEEALLRHVLGRSIQVRMLHYSKLPPPDEIAAWLRFRSDQNTVQALAS